MKKLAALLFSINFLLIAHPTIAAKSTTPARAKQVILFVWDGLRPDSVTQTTTPNLYQFMKDGVEFADNHSSYPTFTMMNAGSFATGSRAGRTGFFGNTLWHPGIKGFNAEGKMVDFSQPVFTEDYKILQDLDTDKLLLVGSLFGAAHQQKLITANIGKTGPAFMQDYLSHGYTLDEKHVSPLSFAKQLQQDGYPLPKLSSLMFKAGELVLKPDNGAPTDAGKIQLMADGITPDGSDTQGSPYNQGNEYMMTIYIKEILAKKQPQLSVIWLRNPDTTEHNYGPGSPNYRDALLSNDKLFAMLLAALKQKNLLTQTDILVVSDHAHSTVSGPLDEFPLRSIENKKVGSLDSKGFSVSGEIRVADFLTKAGFHAYDGVGCVYNPILSGIKADNTPLHPTQIDSSGAICGAVGTKYTTRSYTLPKKLPKDAVIIAANGGTDYIYVPSHNKELVNKVAFFLASNHEFGALFVDSTRYGALKGTVPLSTIGLQNNQGRSPDLIVGLSYDSNAIVQGLPGIEFSDYMNTRGMHGSFSPIDVHNFLAASGPDFRKHFVDKLPTGNTDVAPTIAYLLGLRLPQNDGRVLNEALVSSAQKHAYKTEEITITAKEPMTGLTTYDALKNKTPETQFTTQLYVKLLTDGANQYSYFDKAEGIRK